MICSFLDSLIDWRHVNFADVSDKGPYKRDRRLDSTAGRECLGVPFIRHMGDVLTRKTTTVFPLCVCLDTLCYRLFQSIILLPPQTGVSVSHSGSVSKVCESICLCICVMTVFNEHAAADFLTWTKHVEKAAFPWILLGPHCPFNTYTHKRAGNWIWRRYTAGKISKAYSNATDNKREKIHFYRHFVETSKTIRLTLKQKWFNVS